MPAVFPREKVRYLTHAILALLSALACLIVYWLEPEYRPVRILTAGLGYVSLIFLAVTLLIGPWKLLGQRRNPVNINLRRDVGIWTGITGLLHVLFGLQVHLRGTPWLYFVEQTGQGFSLRRDLFGVGNYLGAAATLILLLLLLLSNDISLRALKGPRWKWLQRTNYLLVTLVVAHTFAYQVVAERPPLLVVLTVLLVGLVLFVQLVGVRLYLRGRARRATSNQSG